MAPKLKHSNLLTFISRANSLYSAGAELLKTFILFVFLFCFSFCTSNAVAQFTDEFDRTTLFERMGVEGKPLVEFTRLAQDSNNDDNWNKEGAGLAVLNHPPFWRTWWAFGFYVSVFLGLILLVRRGELKKLHLRRELELEYINAEKLSELDTERNKFFSNISHEFRTPLTLILGPLDRYIGKVKDEGHLQELTLIRRNARRLQTLINQLLSLSKLESGRMKLRARPENIAKLCRVFVQSFQSIADSRGITLEYESDAEEHIVYIDTLKIEKVANNLLSNAFKFTEKGGKIMVSISVSSISPDTTPGIEIKVKDTGIGIRKEKIPFIFNRFYQVDAEQMKTYLGTGIGLALTKELVELHHGTITVDSEPGLGTTFTVFLQSGKEHLSEDEILLITGKGPEIEEELFDDDYVFIQDVVSQPETTEKAQNSNHPLLLIVEDNDDMRSYIKSYLVDSYSIIEAANGKEGAEKAIEEIPDLIISDLMMPIVDGSEMTSRLKNDERTSHIPIILLTAKASTESRLEGLESGADDFLTKPFDAKELQVRIKNLILQRGKLRKLLSQHIGDAKETRLISASSCEAMTKMDEQFLEKATTIIHGHLSDSEFNVEKFAMEMAMSRVQLHRKLKALADQSASDFMRRLRMKKAVELLREGELNVTQVGFEVGIPNQSYFAKTFKEIYGVTPSEFV